MCSVERHLVIIELLKTKMFYDFQFSTLPLQLAAAHVLDCNNFVCTGTALQVWALQVVSTRGWAWLRVQWRSSVIRWPLIICLYSLLGSAKHVITVTDPAKTSIGDLKARLHEMTGVSLSPDGQKLIFKARLATHWLWSLLYKLMLVSYLS